MLKSPQSATVVANAAHAYAPSTIQYATLEEVINFFQDPLDVESLLNDYRMSSLMGKINEGLTFQGKKGFLVNYADMVLTISL